MKLHFCTHHVVCPKCGSRLRAYKTETRSVKSLEFGEFVAVHHIMRCPNDHTIFKSDELADIVGPYCIYAYDVVIDAATKRFIDGMSSSEIPKSTGIGISGSHVRRLSNMILCGFSRMHEENTELLAKSMDSYILQIDGTPDSEFAMIVVVRDSISGFVLWSKKCSSESYGSTYEILSQVKARFGSPSGIISDMRPGILQALREIFPGVPKRICCFHFLRGLGSDLMKSMHSNLGNAINRMGIKSPIRNLLRTLLPYDTEILQEIENGYCSSESKMEMMALRGILEPLAKHYSSGYGFPFSLRHLEFFLVCEEAYAKLAVLKEKISSEDAKKCLEEAERILSKVAKNSEIIDMADRLKRVNAIFHKLRTAFNVPDHGNLSEDMGEENHEACDLLTAELDVFIGQNITDYERKAAKCVISAYRKWEPMLFAQNADGTIPRTNNSIEQFFRTIRRNVRKRCGNMATGHMLSLAGEKIAIFQNMVNPQYRKIVFGSEDAKNAAMMITRYCKHTRKTGMPKSKVIELVNLGIKMMLSNSLPQNPYTEEMIDQAFISRHISSNIGVGGSNGL